MIKRIPTVTKNVSSKYFHKFRFWFYINMWYVLYYHFLWYKMPKIKRYLNGPKSEFPTPRVKRVHKTQASLDKLKDYYEKAEKEEKSHFLKTHRNAFREKNKLKRMIRKRENQIAKDNGTFVPHKPLTIDQRRVPDASALYHGFG